MKFLANENFPKPSITFLRQKGYYVKSIQEELSGISDEAVVKIAEQEQLIILTFDSDYGEILFKHLRESPPSVVYFRFKGRSPAEAAQILLELVVKKDLKLAGYFTVIEETGIRQRKL
jgi:predicted nuclease of predicted toxin-antitoxin system